MDLLLALGMIVLILNILFSFSLIFIERRDPTTTWAWLLIMIVLPGIGFIIYLMFGQNLSRQKMFKEKTIDDAKKRKILNAMYESNISSHDGGEKFFDLRKMNFNNSGAKYRINNDIDVYVNGEDKFKQLLQDIRNAKRYIHVEYYIFKKDILGKAIIDELTKKAEEGLEVRLLVDAMGSRKLTKKVLKKYIAAGGKFSLFFPGILPHLNTRINYRNHRKIVVIDNKIGYVGGFNIGDEYLGKDKKFGPWRDTHLRMVGTSVLGLKLRFMKDWHYASKEPIGELKSFKIPINTNGKSGVQVLTSGPDTTNPNIKNVIFKMINDAKKEIFIQTPYFIPDDSVMEAIKTAILSGVEVNLMVPSFGDHPLVYWANLSYIGELLKLGANIYHYNNGFLHSKVVIVDDYISTVGSANIDNRSFYLNFEVNAVIYDFDKNKELKDQFYKDIEVSNKYTLEEYNNRTRMTKIKESVSKLFSPIL